MMILKNENIYYLNDILIEDEKLKVVDSSVYNKIPSNHIKLFCLKNGFYQLPTTELVNWIKDKIDGRKTIEIGAGNGSFAKALGIIATDSYMQERPEITAWYKQIGQTPVKYGKHVKKMDYRKAIKKYNPKIVISNWVTQIYKPDSDQGNIYGVDENWIINRVETYIHIGNKLVHKKRILSESHDEYQFPWLVSRASQPELNVIYVWKKKIL